MSTGLTVFEDGAASIVIDERCWPLVASTWFGSATESLVTSYFAHADGQIDRARRARQKIGMITDTYATSPPSAKVRQLIGELSRKQSADARLWVLSSHTVIENALIRGVVTALSWIDPSMADTKNVASFDAAVEGALAAFRTAGLPTPANVPTRARNPARESRSA